MIYGIICTILGVLGIYGFFTGNELFLNIGAIAIVVEIIIGIIKGEAKGIPGLGICFISTCILCALGFTLFKAIAISLCFIGVIGFLMGILLIIIFGKIMGKQENY